MFASLLSVSTPSGSGFSFGFVIALGDGTYLDKDGKPTKTFRNAFAKMDPSYETARKFALGFAEKHGFFIE